MKKNLFGNAPGSGGAANKQLSFENMSGNTGPSNQPINFANMFVSQNNKGAFQATKSIKLNMEHDPNTANNTNSIST